MTAEEESPDMAAAVEKTDAQAQELTGLKDDLVTVASQTVDAISQLRQSVAALATQRRGAASEQPARARVSEERRSRGARGRDRERGSEASGERASALGGVRGEMRGDKWARLKEVQQATHTMLQRLDGVVSKIAAAKAARRTGALRRYSRESKQQIGALATEVSEVARKLQTRRRLQRRHVSETHAVRRQLASLSRTAERRVRRAERVQVSSLAVRPQGDSAQEVWKGTGGFDAAAKAAKILKVKQRADKQLNTLLAQVNEEIQRKAWRAKEARDGKGLA